MLGLKRKNPDEVLVGLLMTNEQLTVGHAKVTRVVYPNNQVKWFIKGIDDGTPYLFSTKYAMGVVQTLRVMGEIK